MKERGAAHRGIGRESEKTNMNPNSVFSLFLPAHCGGKGAKGSPDMTVEGVVDDSDLGHGRRWRGAVLGFRWKLDCLTTAWRGRLPDVQVQAVVCGGQFTSLCSIDNSNTDTVTHCLDSRMGLDCDNTDPLQRSCS